MSVSAFVGLGLFFGLSTAILSVYFIPILFLGVASWILVLVSLSLIGYRNRERYHLGRNNAYRAVLGIGIGFVVAFFGTVYAFQWFILITILLGIGKFGYSSLQMRCDRSQSSPEMQRFLRTFVEWTLPAGAVLFLFLFVALDLLRMNTPWIVPLGVIVFLVPSGIGIVKSFKSLRSSKSRTSPG